MPYAPNTELLNKYRIESLIGAGAFGEVYRAQHLALQAPCALKILRHDAPGVGSSDFQRCRERFQLEAQLGAKLRNQPYVIQVYDFEHDGETLILVTEFAPGGSLAEKLERAREANAPMPVEAALNMGREIAAGLAALHALDAVHRDLKPSNILFDAQGHAKLADFGLAQLPGGPSMRSRFSTPEPHPGTPAYMSPEQRETSDHLTSASDIYALGCVLFEALTGRVYRSQRPGTRVTALRGDVPGWIDALVARCLEKEIEARPWDGAELLELLRWGEAEEAAQTAARQQREAEAAARKQRELEEIAARKQREAEEAACKQREVEELLLQQQREAEEAARQAAAQEATARKQREAEATRKQREADDAAREAATREATVRRQREAEAAARKQREAEEEARKQRQDKEAARQQPEKGGLRHKLSQLFAPMAVDQPAPTSNQQQATGDQQLETRNSQLNLTIAPHTEMAFMRIPAGEFLMGSDPKVDSLARGDEQPQRKVHLDGYWMGKTPVTNAQYAAFVKATSRPAPRHWQSGRIPSGKKHHPVVNVSWEDAAAFCTWASQVTGREVRLPTEAEWEKAARGADGRIYPWGKEAPDKSRCNFASNENGTTPVGKYSPQGDSPYGCVDIAGNVWEWCADWYDEDYYKTAPARNPRGPQKGAYRVLRGGSWNYDEYGARGADRFWYSPSFTYISRGFRCGVSAAPGE